MKFEIIHKPTFTNQLLVIPQGQIGQILQKVEYLRTDPSPEGKLKKKLHGYKGDVYRLRSGDYRIIYTYGDGWVALLGVDNRKDVYKHDKLVADETTLDVGALPSLEDALDAKETIAARRRPARAGQVEPEHLLPTPIDGELLTRLRVDERYFPALLACRTIDDLLAADVPSDVQNRVFDGVAAPDFDRVLAQPSYVTGATDNLLKFAEGELLGFLLKLDPQQEKYVNRALGASGPTLLKGSPGTGKSTVAIYRVRALLAALRANGVSDPRILFTTYTNALVTFSQQLLASLLGEDDIRHVEVKTADAIARDIVYRADKTIEIASQAELRRLMARARTEAISALTGNALQRQAQAQTLKRLTVDYLLEEVNSVVEARELKTLDAYLATPRTGRSVPLNRTQRVAVWHLREHFYQLLAREDTHTWPQVRTRALEILRAAEHPLAYDAVVVDEAQDLDPNALCLLVTLCRRPNMLFVTADANQSIYGGCFRWANVHGDLQFRGRTGILKINYRTTREISEAAGSYAVAGLLEAVTPEITYLHSGPLPSVRAVADRHDEIELLLRYCRTAAHEFRLGTGACAVLVPSAQVGAEIAAQLTHLGLDAEFMTGRTLDLNKPVVKIITLKSAKGLEFPIVALAGFTGGTFPVVPQGTPSEAYEEIMTRERRTLFVGMTRAMRALLIIIPAYHPSALLQNFDPQFWNLGSATTQSAET